MDFQTFSALPENAGKDIDQLELEWLQAKQAKTSTEREAQQAFSEGPAPIEKGFLETAGDVASGLTRMPGRVAGMALGAVAGVLPSNWDEIAEEYHSFTKEIEENLGKDWLENWTNNLSDLGEATILILATAAGYTPQRKGEGVVEHGFRTGKQFSTGAISGTAALLMNPIDAFYSRPADVAGFLAHGLLRLRARARTGDARAKLLLDKIGSDKGKSGRGTGMNILRSIAETPVPKIPGMRRPKKRVPLEVGAEEAFLSELGQIGGTVPASLGKAAVGLPDAPAVTPKVRPAPEVAFDAPAVKAAPLAEGQITGLPPGAEPLRSAPPPTERIRAGKPFEALEGEAPLTVGDLVDSMVAGAAGGLPFGTIEPALYAPLVRYLWGVAEGTPAGRVYTGKLRRFFSSPAAQALLADEQQLRQIMRERHKFRALINREGDPILRRSSTLTAADYPTAFKMRGDFPTYELRKGESSVVYPTERGVREAQAGVHRIADADIQRRKLGIQPGDKTPISRVMTQREIAGRMADIEHRPVEIRVADLGKEGQRAIRNIQDLMDSVRLGKLRQLEFQASVLDSMQDGSTLLMSEALRNRLVSQVLNQLKLKPAESARVGGALQKQLLEKFQKPIRIVDFEGKKQFARAEPGKVTIEGGPTVSLDKALEATFKGMKESERANVRAEVISRIIRQAADDASRAAFLKAMKKESRRQAHAGVDEALQTGRGAVSVASYADGMILAHAIDGKPINQVLPRGMSPLKVADSVRAQQPSALAEAANRAGRELTPAEMAEISTRIDDMAVRLEKYEEFTDKGDLLLPEQDLFPTEKIERDMANMDPANLGYNPNAMYVSPGFNATVGWNQLSRATEGALWDGLNSFTTFVKGNLTVHNPITHIGNYTSNVGVTSLMHGRTPIRMVLESTNEVRKYLNYKAGRKVSQMDNRAYRAIDTTKISKSDLAHVELGLMEQMGAAEVIPHLRTVTENVLAPARALWKKYDNAMKEGYKWGDQSFKIYETSRGFRELAYAVDALSEGEYMRFRTSPTAYTTIHKSGGKMWRAKEALPTEHLDRILAGVAAKRAMDLFVDYSQVPGMLIMLRRMSILSIASPFITWFWRVMDLPGKKGLIYRTLVDEPLYQTNSPALLRSTTLNSLYKQARRFMLYQGGRKTLHEEREFMRQLTKYMGMPYGRGLFFESDNPGYFTFMRLNNTDWFAPGMHAARVFAGAIAWRLQAEDYDNLTKTQQRLVNRFARGEVGTMKDIATMAGMAGGPIVEMMTAAITQRNRYGRPLVGGDILKNFMPVLMGQLPYKAVDVAVQSLGVWNEETLLSQRFYSQSPNDPNEREDFGPWVFRTLVGLGWRQASAAGRTQSFIRRTREDMKNSLNGALDKQVKQLRRIGNDQRADDLMDIVAENIERISFEAEQMLAEGEDLEKALSASERVRVDSDAEDYSFMEGFQ